MDSNHKRSENRGGEVNGQDPNASVTFVDVLFAVVMSLGLAQIMTLPWFKSMPEGTASGIAFEILNQSQGGNYILQRWQRRGSFHHQCVGSGL